MRRSFVAATFLVAAAVLAGCSGAMRAKFPTEEEVRRKLARGMTAEQVLATFGEPPGHQWVDVKLGGKVHYIAPVAARTRPGEGYTGFTVYFDRGKVWDWEVILMNPSYEHRLLASRRTQWALGLAAVMLIAVAAYGGLRFAQKNRSEDEALREAYSVSEIPTDELPPDFAFITRATTLQTVIDTAGPYSRVKKLRLQTEAGEASPAAFAYDLPSGGAVFVMPEPPFELNSRIRAVSYRRPPGGPQI